MKKTSHQNSVDEAVLLMLGIGKQLWDGEPGDAFVERLRSDDAPGDPSTVCPQAGNIVLER
jgi:hypothetical protein